MIENVLAFFPYGLLFSVNAKRLSFGKKFVIILLTSVAFETLQYIFAIGVTDINDVMTNATGGLIGLALYELMEKTFSDSHKLDKVSNMIWLIGLTFFVLFGGMMLFRRLFGQ